MNETNQCEKYSSPAQIIEILQADKSPYEVYETKEKGKLVKVRVVDIADKTQYVYYTNKAACEKTLNQKKRKQQAELDRYR